ncbi:MAG: BrnT family toxin [Bacteroidetes bacterium]|nr:BrnT family toxin [Bacteroidota bacterium]
MDKISFEWDERKNLLNQKKHDVSFEEAQYAFMDAERIIARDIEHSSREERYYCFGKTDENILTVRFIYRNNKIRIIGAGYWRKGKKIYEKENKIHK